MTDHSSAALCLIRLCRRRLTAAEAIKHPFFDEHIPGFGPRMPEAEKPADARE